MKHLLAILIGLSFFGCYDSVKKPKRPDNLISEAKMVDIMYDTYLLNSAKGINKKMLEINGIYPQNYVYEKYGIDSTQFANSNNYYAYDTKTYESILQRIKDKINITKKEYEDLDKAEEKERQAKADSIKKAKARERDSLSGKKLISEIKPEGKN